MILEPLGQNFLGFGLFPSVWVFSLYKSDKFQLSRSGSAFWDKHENVRIYWVCHFVFVIPVSESCLSLSKTHQ